MLKNSIIQEFYDMENKLEALREAVFHILENDQKNFDHLPGNEINDLNNVFNCVRSIWNIPTNIPPTIPLTKIQETMSKGIPENWASRQIVKLREE